MSFDLHTATINKIDLYKEQYLFEHERSKFYDNIIRYPTTLLILFIGAGLYSFEKYFDGNEIIIENRMDLTFIICSGFLSLSLFITTVFLAIMYHGFTRRYDYLPLTGDLYKHERDLYKHYYKYSDNKNYSLKREEAFEKTYQKFVNDLIDYYVRLTEANQILNDRRANSYFYTRSFLFSDLIFLIIIGIISIIN